MSIRQHVTDATNATAAGTFIVAGVQNWTMEKWTAFFGLIYMVLLVADKLGLLNPLKSAGARAWRRVRGLPG